MNLKVGTRGSKLALAQTEIVIEKLLKLYPEISIEKEVIVTKGDKILDKSLEKIGDKGIFVSEIEDKILKGEIDFAVHSLKDMPTKLNEGLLLMESPQRVDPRDVLIVNPKHNLKHFEIKDWLTNNNGLKIGTGSKRRSVQLKIINDSIQVCMIRGNINTRINKLVDEDMDAIVIAAAGVNRLQLEDDLCIYYFGYDEMIPSPAQGALAIELRSDNNDLINIFNSIVDKENLNGIKAERSFLKNINGGCHIPVGAISVIEDGKLRLTGIYGNEDCSKIIVDEVIGNINDAEEIGKKLASKILENF